MKTLLKINADMIVEDAILIADEHSDDAIQFVTNVLGLEGFWVEIDSASIVPGSTGGIGFYYDKEAKRFIPPQPFASWILNMETYQWDPPIPYPLDGANYNWNEVENSWVKVILPTEHDTES